MNLLQEYAFLGELFRFTGGKLWLSFKQSVYIKENWGWIGLKAICLRYEFFLQKEGHNVCKWFGQHFLSTLSSVWSLWQILCLVNHGLMKPLKHKLL